MINLILLKTIYGLGDLGDVVSVRPGYARNYLVPQGFATIASKFALSKLSLQEEQIREKRDSVAAVDADLCEKLEEIRGKVNIYVASVMDGKFFGSVSVQDFIGVVKKLGITLERSQVYFPSKKVKSVGEYETLVRVGKDRRVNVPFSVRSVHSSEEEEVVES